MESTIEQGIEALAGDIRSGATELTRRAAELLRRALTESAASTAEQLQAEIGRWGTKIIQAQPGMTPLFHLVRRVRRAIDPALDPDQAREGGLHALDEFLDHLRKSPWQIADNFLEAISTEVTILTHSFSETVLTALLHAKASGRRISVVVTESRPQLEGRTLALYLHRAGIPTTLIVDAAAAQLMATVTLAVVGADTICESGVVNKIGTRMIALAAQELNVPLFALAATSKFRPSNLPTLEWNQPRPAADVWENPPEGLGIWNQYFELTPLHLFTAVITESGRWTPVELVETLRQYENCW